MDTENATSSGLYFQLPPRFLPLLPTNEIRGSFRCNQYSSVCGEGKRQKLQEKLAENSCIHIFQQVNGNIKIVFAELFAQRCANKATAIEHQKKLAKDSS